MTRTYFPPEGKGPIGVGFEPGVIDENGLEIVNPEQYNSDHIDQLESLVKAKILKAEGDPPKLKAKGPTPKRRGLTMDSFVDREDVRIR
jgi:hypothetical protein